MICFSLKSLTHGTVLGVEPDRAALLKLQTAAGAVGTGEGSCVRTGSLHVPLRSAIKTVAVLGKLVVRDEIARSAASNL